MGRSECVKLRMKKKDELEADLESYRKELQGLRVAQVAGGAPAKVMQIRNVRKSIARVLTIMNQNRAENMRKFYKSKKYIPTDLRWKKTRAMRRRLTKKQQNRVTTKEWKRKIHFPMRKFAINQN